MSSDEGHIPKGAPSALSEEGHRAFSEASSKSMPRLHDDPELAATREIHDAPARRPPRIQGEQRSGSCGGAQAQRLAWVQRFPLIGDGHDADQIENIIVRV
jgi:hypothetical protein